MSRVLFIIMYIFNVAVMDMVLVPQEASTGRSSSPSPASDANSGAYPDRPLQIFSADSSLHFFMAL